MSDTEKIHSTPPRPSGRRDFCFACAVIGTVFAVLAVHTWRKWPDILVDFGLQLYCPWKLSTGSVLYRDMAYLAGGPLSQYYHAFLFKIFGVSFLTLIMSNLLLTVVLLLLIYRCFYRSSDQLTAITACLAIVTVFAFAQHSSFGIFNYITPYCSEIVHGLVLSVFAVALMAKWFCEEKLRLAAAVGFCCGLAFLTKPEVFLALGISVSGGLLLFWRVREKPRFLLRSLGTMMAAAVIPVSAFLIYFWRMTDFRAACQAVCGGWIPVLTTHTSENPYFRWCMGLDAPAFHLQRMFRQSFGLAIIVAASALLCRRRAPGGLSRSLPVFAAAGLAALALIFDWSDCGQCLPVVCLALLTLQLWRAKVSGLEPGAVFPLLWTFFSLGMLVKLGLFSRVWHYGFVLGMPAFLCAIYLLLWLLPRELERFNVHPLFLRGLLWAPLMIGLAQLTAHAMIPYAWKTVPVGAGADKMWGDNPQYRPEDTDMIMALHWMETNAPPQATLSVLPTGIMLNYLSRRTNPSRYPIWPPPEVAAFGQQKMTGDFIRNSPDYIILVGTDFAGFGEKYFGMEERYGRDLMKWVNAHYEQKCLIGDNWLQTGRFGVKILQKTPASGLPTGRRG
jgi:4-amino-4-deoxy-L-arabinose transferase-like glycosyltransferase